MDRWETFPIEFGGGLITNLSPLQHGAKMPGSARNLINFEPSIEGGYRRIEGFSKFDSNQLSGSGNVRGVVNYNNKVYASRGSHLYESSGSGWTQITDNASFSSTGISLGGTGKVRFALFNFDGTEKLIVVDGTSKPFLFDGSTFSQITSATSDVQGSDIVVEFANHIFFANGTSLIFSAPFDETDYTAASGAGVISYNHEITALSVFRNQLVVFTTDSIHTISGNSLADFVNQSVTDDLGCIAKDTAREIGGDIAFLAVDGIRLLSATERNNDFGLAVISKTIQTETNILVDNSTSFCSLTVREKSQYRIFGFNGGFTKAASRGILFTQFSAQGGASIGWAETRGIKAFVASSAYVDDEEICLFANDDGFVYRMEDSNSFDGENIQANFSTPFIPIKDPQVRKTFYKATVYIDPDASYDFDFNLKFDFNKAGVVQPATISVSNNANLAGFFGTAVYGTAVYAADLRPVAEEQVVGSGFAVSTTFESNSSDPPFSLDSVVLQYATYGRR